MKEYEIRPKELFDRYLELSRKDAMAFDKNGFENSVCPGCGSENSEHKFSKNGFTYSICRDCASVFCSPRPTEETIKKFYEESESSKYWSTVFFPAVAELRREKLFKIKAEKICSLLKELKLKPAKICDVGAGYGILLEELRKLIPESSFYAIEPCHELA